MEQEIELINGCKNGCRRSQNLFYNKYYKTMYRMVNRYIECPFVAEEVTNDGFIRAFKKMDSFNFKGSVEGWLRKIVFHAISDAVKVDERIKGSDKNLRTGLIKNVAYYADGEERIDVYGSVEPKIDADYKLIQKGIETLLTKQTLSAFRLHINGYIHKEIGSMIGCTEGTVKWHISEAKKLIREKLFNNFKTE